jgi:hypothetical protein
MQEKCDLTKQDRFFMFKPARVPAIWLSIWPGKKTGRNSDNRAGQEGGMMSDQHGYAPRGEHADFAEKGRRSLDLRLAGRPGFHSVDVISGAVHAL